ncbi:MAG: GIY-YIG nuclease family protein [Nanoarchaeota archaeon]
MPLKLISRYGETKNIPGVYLIINMINKNIYIGSTKNGIRNRLRKHFNQLKNKNHKNPYLQNAFNLYGIENFKVETILYCDKDKARFFEQKCLDKYRPFPSENRGYNLLKDAEDWTGTKHTVETIKKQKEVKSHLMKPVERIDPETGEVKEYESLKDTRKDGFTYGKVADVCNGKMMKHKGFYWQFLNKKDQIIDLSLRYNKQCKPVISTHCESGQIEAFPGITEAAKILKVNKSAIFRCVKRTFKNFVWKILEISR